MMSDIIVDVAQVITSFAMVASVIYLGIQIRQNRIIMKLHFGYKLNERELTENIERIKNIELTKIGGGYLCSSCDPLLLLYCEIFFLGIDINFNGTPLEYRNVKYNDRVLNFSASSSHFS